MDFGVGIRSEGVGNNEAMSVRGVTEDRTCVSLCPVETLSAVFPARGGVSPKERPYAPLEQLNEPVIRAAFSIQRFYVHDSAVCAVYHDLLSVTHWIFEEADS